MAERPGITRQSYAYFEANPATATLARLFMVLRMRDVEILLDQASPATRKGAMPSATVTRKHPSTAKAIGQKIRETPGTVVIRKVTQLAQLVPSVPNILKPAPNSISHLSLP